MNMMMRMMMRRRRRRRLKLVHNPVSIYLL
jgi:hypothetical protein